MGKRPGQISCLTGHIIINKNQHNIIHCDRLCSKYFTNSNSFVLIIPPKVGNYIYLYFKNEESETQSGLRTFPSHTAIVLELLFKPM